MKKLLTTPFVFAGLALILCQALGCKTVESSVTVDDSELASITALDYSDWAYTVETYVNDQGKVKYATLAGDDERLNKFVAVIAKVGPTTRPELFDTDDKKLTYYINAYNALVMLQVLSNYPEIGTVYDGNGVSFFYATKFKLDGGEINLYDIENEIVRKQFGEPRIHFALNCASESCPRLPNTAFSPDTLQDELEREAQKFTHNERNVRLEGNKVYLSQIFEWYADDFKPTNIDWVKKTAPDLNIPDGAEIEYIPYDWKLNDQDR